MPNKYSHALVISHYQSRGLIRFPHSPPSSYVAPLPVESRLRVTPKSPPPKSPSPVTNDVAPNVAPNEQSRSSTPMEPAVTIEPTPSLRTSSITTEIYAPKRTSSPSYNPRPISPDPSLASLSFTDLDAGFEEEFSVGTSPLSTTASAESSSVVRSTPRSSVSPIPESPILGPHEDFPPSREIYPIIEDCPGTPWENPQVTPAVFRLQSLDLSHHSQLPVRYSPARSPPARSPSPDDAVPPPITRYRRLSGMAFTKPNRTSTTFTKPSQSSPSSGINQSASDNANSDRPRANRNTFGEWAMGSKVQR
ncbi:hypothetical protein MMC07_007691 [Pseudocyphellaria aurata]|nr:hypothetical protein [Pseudocyphellaria aurata]